MAHGARSSPRLRGSPPNSSSSSDFEFTVSLSPSSTYSALCPADELFYKGQLLPLHLSPRISMVRTLLLSSSSSSSSSDSSITTTTTASRDSTSSSSSDLLLPDSSRPSSATADEDPHPLPLPPPPLPKRLLTVSHYFSSLASRFLPRSSSKRSTPKEVFKKYVKKVKPLFSKKSDDLAAKKTFSFSSHSQSFSGNLRCPRRTCAGSCPSSMRSSPSHSGLLYAGGAFPAPTNSSSSSMEELQSAIQGAIAHCKSSMVSGNQKKGFCSLMVSSDKNSGA
ncbi:putative BKI1/putative membrane-associated kinase regulator/4 [Dioscorea sansibarensis]